MTFAGTLSSNTSNGIQQLMLTLEKVAPRMKGRKEDLDFVKKVVGGNDFRSLMHIHNEVKFGSTRTDEPVTKNSVGMSNIMCYHLESTLSRDASELFDLLSSPHIFALLSAHDKVANQEYPRPVAMETDETDGENTKDNVQLRCVRIERNNVEPLGATIKLNKDGMVTIGRVLHRSVADKSGMLHSGDIVHKINDQNLHRGSNIDTVADLMQGLTGTIELLISTSRPERAPKRRNLNMVRLKTMFDYDPSKDQHLPCREAGLAFTRGMVLYVLDQEDPNWWQAVHDGGGKNYRAGLIPSKTLRERLEYKRLHKQLLTEREKKPSTLRRKITGTSQKRQTYNPHTNEDYSCDEILSYEEVIKIGPQVNRPRPIILVGPEGGAMDFQALINHLVTKVGEKFELAVKYGTRTPAPTGKFKVVSQQHMEQAILNNELLEYEKDHGHYTGTALREVKNVIQTGKTCLLTVNPQYLKVARCSDLKPFVVFFRTPDMDHMRNTWRPQHTITEPEMRRMVQQGANWEMKYSHLFDELIVFTDKDQAYQQLLTISQRLREEYQWVTSSWVKK